jgi:hypothetical protein
MQGERGEREREREREREKRERRERKSLSHSDRFFLLLPPLELTKDELNEEVEEDELSHS